MKRSNLNIWIIPIIFLAGMSGLSFAEKTIYVDADATGKNNGSSWAEAYTCLQEALADANSSAKPVQILVAAGIYKPDQGESQTSGNREAAFQLINGVIIKGGYAGFGEEDPNDRDVSLYKTILSGDLNGNDLLNLWLLKSDNSAHIIIGSGTDANAVLDGFTITGGQGLQGGGMYNANGSPTIANCTFSRNEAHSGGAIYNTEGSNPTLIMCVFSENYVLSEQIPGSGGGIYNQNSNPVLVNCTFSRNAAVLQGVGGGMSNYQSNPTLVSCEFIANSAEAGGGAIFNDQSRPTMTNCAFSANSATDGTGGAMDSANSSPTLINCTFAANRASSGNALAFWQSQLEAEPEQSKLEVEPDLCQAYIANCILWDDSAQIWNEDGSTIIIAYTDVQGGQTEIYDPYNAVVWGEGNIDADPCFANPGYWACWNDLSVVIEPDDPNAVWVDGDYHLKSQTGRWEPKTGVWVQDEVTSPCIDAGDILSSFALETLPNGGRINMGAYGGTTEASKSPLTEQPEEPEEGQEEEEKEEKKEP